MLGLVERAIPFWQQEFVLAEELIRLTIIGLLVTILLNLKGWRNAVHKCFPSSLRVNLLTYAFNAIVLAAPLGMIFASGMLLRSIQVIPPLWFEGIPTWLIGLGAVFIGDFTGYFRHRFEHSALLWPAHSLHHSDETMTWFTLFRFHPINRLSTHVIDNAALFMLGLPLWSIALSGLVRHYYGMFVHVDRPWTLGLLGKLFVSPAMHRWHHVRAGQGMRSNYATVFSVFDKIFNTHYVPGPCYEPLGVEGVIHTEFVTQMLSPFALWKKRAKGKAAAPHTSTGFGPF